MELTLPWPPSLNHYWRKWRNRMVISKEGREYRTAVCDLLASENGIRKPPAGGRIALSMDAFPPDRRARDLDNLYKGVNDSLEHAGVYENDSQIDLLLSRRCDIDRPKGHLVVRIDVLPLAVCPLCGNPYSQAMKDHSHDN